MSGEKCETIYLRREWADCEKINGGERFFFIIWQCVCEKRRFKANIYQFNQNLKCVRFLVENLLLFVLCTKLDFAHRNNNSL